MSQFVLNVLKRVFEMKKEFNLSEKKEWEEALLTALINIGKKDYDAGFFARMLIKVLWVLEDE